MQKGHKIDLIREGSIAEEMELESGDILLTINGEQMEDVFDYQYLCEDEFIVLEIEKKNGEIWELEIEKDEDEDIGLIFADGLMADYKSCRNKCIFCFIDQMPKGMRETLYFKDDDSRLSFLQGNYVTLTNMTEQDIDRIIKYHLGPINISFHTTNPQLRCKMLNNRFAGDIFPLVDKLYEAGIEMNGQIVLCKGVNDGKELERSISDLSKYVPVLQSVSVVPVGLTKYRDGLFPMKPFTKEDACEVIDMIHSWQDKIYKEHGTHFIHAGDEWYIMAERDFPDEDSYDGYIQLENGVGMVRLFKEEFAAALENAVGDDRKAECSIATGVLAAPMMEEAALKVKDKFPNVNVRVYTIINEFFGEKITVAGLITGQDLLKQLTDRDLGDKLLLSKNMLRWGETVFLDDVTTDELQEKLSIPIEFIGLSGEDFLNAVIDNEPEEPEPVNGYEINTIQE